MLAYDRTGSLIVLTDGAELLVHDGPSEGPLWRRDCGAPLVAVGATSDAVIAVDRNGRVQWFDARRDNIQATVDTRAKVRAAAVSAGGEVVVLTDSDARVLTREGERLVLPWPDGRAAAWSSDRRLVLTDAEGKAGEFDSLGNFLRGVQLEPAIAAVAWNPQGFWVLASGTKIIRWDGEGMHHLTGGPEDIAAVACSADGSRIAITLKDNFVLVLSWPARDTVGQLNYLDRKVDGLAFGPAPWLAVGLVGGDGNKFNLLGGSLNRTDTHPGRQHNRWTVGVTCEPPNEPAAATTPPPQPAEPTRPAYAPPAEPAAPAKSSSVATIVTVLVVVLVGLYAFVRYT